MTLAQAGLPGSPSHKAPAAAIWALGLTQIVGYGTLFYSYAILAPAIALELGWSQEWVYGALSASLLAGGFVAPQAGRLADRIGAAQAMAGGSLAASLALVLCAFAPEPYSFLVALVAMQIAASFVLYSTAFVAIVQIAGRGAALGITHLTLIAGFASTLFWPLTSWMHQALTWREVYLVFAVMNVAICLPVHIWLARFSRRRGAAAALLPSDPVVPHAEPQGTSRKAIFALMLLGFGVEGFVLTSILVHMVPLTGALGMGAAGLYAATLFGPAQVASRLVNMVFGGRLPQAWLAFIAASFLPVGLSVLLLTTPLLEGALVFVILFGMGSGLNSIVAGTLPLELFGRSGYGRMVGWATAARQFSAAFAPFALSAMMAGMGVSPALWVLAATGLIGLLAFVGIAILRRGHPRLA